jgi:hypothetical protein
MFFYAKTIAPVYSARSTVFPLNATNDNSGATSALVSSMLGLSETPKSFSQDASINIVELALSRNLREAVAMDRMGPELGNKTVAELLIEAYNRNKPLFGNAIKLPSNPAMLAAVGGSLLKEGVTAKINKNGILEINFSNTNEDLITPVSYKFIDKISEFYKELKIKKAKLDYDFTLIKMDSLDSVIKTFDRKAIHMANTTLFVTPDKIQYTIPKENLVEEKERVSRQRNANANNREEALWRLQKMTPIISVLDRPDPPFDIQKPSALLYAMIGFFVSIILLTGLLISGILYRYAKEEAKKAIFGSEEENVTPAAS